MRMLTPAALVLTVSCGGNTVTVNTMSEPDPGPLRAVLEVTENGGCVRLGPNCAIHTLYADGKVTVGRAGLEDKPVSENQIDSGQVISWLSLVESTDFSALRNRLPVGSCSACVDGVDLEYRLTTSSSTVVFNTVEHKLDESEPFFALTNGVYNAMRVAAPLEFIQHETLQ